MRALTSGLAMAVRSVAVPWLLGPRWAEAGADAARRPTLGLKLAADELFFALEILCADVIAPGERHRVRREIDAALAFYERHGWLDDPSGYHGTPSAPRQVTRHPVRAWGRPRLPFEHVAFESGWTPHRGEPGRERWLAYEPNRTAHVWLLRHAGPARPCVVCVPGYRMGNPAVDLAGFRARWLHRTLGLDVAIPVLPFHGPRRVGRRGGDGFLSGDVLDTLHAKAQGAWDVRRLLAWLRSQGTPAVALYGVSLGAFTSGVVAGLEDELAAVVAGIPAADFVDILRAHAPAALVRASDRLGFPWDEIRGVLRVVSPLAFPPRVPRHRRFLYAATDDRLAPPEQARALWKHWEQPRIAWYRGSHCSFLWERAARDLVREALEETGMLASKPEAVRPRPGGARRSRLPRARRRVSAA